ncbi:hypothetical protein E4T56_gene15544 [Termitomyces sp. T112]|nr:hypothetical protein E4T56_gene15544 [Termitomyces sp. T112]
MGLPRLVRRSPARVQLSQGFVYYRSQWRPGVQFLLRKVQPTPVAWVSPLPLIGTDFLRSGVLLAEIFSPPELIFSSPIPTDMFRPSVVTFSLLIRHGESGEVDGSPQFSSYF